MPNKKRFKSKMPLRTARFHIVIGLIFMVVIGSIGAYMMFGARADSSNGVTGACCNGSMIPYWGTSNGVRAKFINVDARVQFNGTHTYVASEYIRSADVRVSYPTHLVRYDSLVMCWQGSPTPSVCSVDTSTPGIVRVTVSAAGGIQPRSMGAQLKFRIIAEGDGSFRGVGESSYIDQSSVRHVSSIYTDLNFGTAIGGAAPSEAPDIVGGNNNNGAPGRDGQTPTPRTSPNPTTRTSTTDSKAPAPTTSKTATTGSASNKQSDKDNSVPSTTSQGDQAKQTSLEPSPFFDGKQYAIGSDVAGGGMIVAGHHVSKLWTYVIFALILGGCLVGMCFYTYMSGAWQKIRTRYFVLKK